VHWVGFVLSQVSKARPGAPGLSDRDDPCDLFTLFGFAELGRNDDENFAAILASRSPARNTEASPFGLASLPAHRGAGVVSFTILHFR